LPCRVVVGVARRGAVCFHSVSGVRRAVGARSTSSQAGSLRSRVWPAREARRSESLHRGSPSRSSASCRVTNAQVTPETRGRSAGLDPRRVPYNMGTRRHQPKRHVRGGGRCVAAAAKRSTVTVTAARASPGPSPRGKERRWHWPCRTDLTGEAADSTWRIDHDEGCRTTKPCRPVQDPQGRTTSPTDGR
jgi:hypothetical protein